MSDHTLQTQVPRSLPQLPYSSLPSALTRLGSNRGSPIPRSLLTQSDPLNSAGDLFEDLYERDPEVSTSQYELVTSIEQRPIASWRPRKRRHSASFFHSEQSNQLVCSQCHGDKDHNDVCTSCSSLPTTSDSLAPVAASPIHAREFSEDNQLVLCQAPTKIVHRAQLVSNLVDIYLAYDKLSKYLNADLANLPAVECTTPTLQAATDAICFVGIGTAHGDERLIAEARVRFGCALHLLSMDLRERPQKSRFRQTVTSIALLRMCELFDSLSFQRAGILAKGWKWHLEAMERYMEECGPEDLLQNDYDWLLFQNIRHYSFYADVLYQRSSMFAEPRWLAMTTAQATRDPGIALYNLRAQLPGLTAKVRSACQLWSRCTEGSSQMVQDLESLRTDIRWLRHSLASWMENSGEVVSSGQMTNMDTTRGNLSTSQALEFQLLRASFHFTSVEKAAQTTTCWMLCMAVNDLHTNVLNSQKILSPEDSVALEEISRDSYVCATNLARCIDWCSQEEVTQMSVVGDFHLRLIEAYFKKAGHVREVEWCEAMREVMASRAKLDARFHHMQLCKKLVADQSGILLRAWREQTMASSI